VDNLQRFCVLKREHFGPQCLCVENWTFGKGIFFIETWTFVAEILCVNCLHFLKMVCLLKSGHLGRVFVC